MRLSRGLSFEGVHPFVANVDWKELKTMTFYLPLIHFLGNKSHAPFEVSQNEDPLITTSTQADTHSLNVEVSGAILIYEIQELLTHG